MGLVCILRYCSFVTWRDVQASTQTLPRCPVLARCPAEISCHSAMSKRIHEISCPGAMSKRIHEPCRDDTLSTLVHAESTVGRASRLFSVLWLLSICTILSTNSFPTTYPFVSIKQQCIISRARLQFPSIHPSHTPRPSFPISLSFTVVSKKF